MPERTENFPRMRVCSGDTSVSTIVPACSQHIVEMIISGGRALVEKVVFKTDSEVGHMITLLILVWYTSTGTCFLVTNQGLHTAVLIWRVVR